MFVREDPFAYIEPVTIYQHGRSSIDFVTNTGISFSGMIRSIIVGTTGYDDRQFNVRKIQGGEDARRLYLRSRDSRDRSACFPETNRSDRDFHTLRRWRSECIAPPGMSGWLRAGNESFRCSYEQRKWSPRWNGRHAFRPQSSRPHRTNALRNAIHQRPLAISPLIKT